MAFQSGQNCQQILWSKPVPISWSKLILMVKTDCFNVQILQMFWSLSIPFQQQTFMHNPHSILMEFHGQSCFHGQSWLVLEYSRSAMYAFLLTYDVVWALTALDICYIVGCWTQGEPFCLSLVPDIRVSDWGVLTRRVTQFSDTYQTSTSNCTEHLVVIEGCSSILLPQSPWFVTIEMTELSPSQVDCSTCLSTQLTCLITLNHW